MSECDFRFSFAPPHTMALSRPSASDKFVAGIRKERLLFLHAYGSLKDVPRLVMDSPKINVQTELTICCDKNELPFQKQHLWTPLSICAYTLDALILEDGKAVHIGAGIPRERLAGGACIQARGLMTHYGKCDLEISESRYKVTMERAPEKPVLLYIRTTEKEEIKEIRPEIRA